MENLQLTFEVVEELFTDTDVPLSCSLNKMQQLIKSSRWNTDSAAARGGSSGSGGSGGGGRGGQGIFAPEITLNMRNREFVSMETTRRMPEADGGATEAGDAAQVMSSSSNLMPGSEILTEEMYTVSLNSVNVYENALVDVWNWLYATAQAFETLSWPQRLPGVVTIDPDCERRVLDQINSNLHAK